MRSRATTLATILVALAVLVSVSVLLAPERAPAAPAPAATSPWTMLPLRAWRGEGAGIYDSSGRQVLLRGMNVNGLGDYYQDNPAYPATIPLTTGDYEELAATGVNVIRLLVHWSALEPTRGSIDQAYLGRIRGAVDEAKAHGLYVVLDMHQDAWGKSIASPPGVVCPAGTEPSIGWDGAPAWATITDGADTCHASVRENAPAVINAFDNFYADRDGIRTDLALTWGALADAFAAEPAVAGYDLFNEPNWGSDLGANAAALAAYYGQAIAAIREAENAARGFEHIVFFEPIVLWPLPGAEVPPGVLTDQNLVFAPHNYFESLNSILTLEQGFSLAAASAAAQGTTFWFGEYGWFGDPATDKEKAVRFGQQEDKYLVGGAWWQWKQACGDPHSIGSPGGTPASTLVHFHRSTCPGDGDQEIVPEWASVVGRPYPRAAPGRLDALASDGDSGSITLSGHLEAGTQSVGQPLELWVPDRGQGEPQVQGTNLTDVSIQTVPGGYRITAMACGQYALAIAAPLASVPDGCNGDPGSVGTQPVVAVPAFTG